jgi:uncharacterized membrane protein YgdD (TMEM256/DUF423 family)
VDRRLFDRLLAGAGAAMAAAGVALSAYGAHAADADAQGRLASAALFALVHGAALAALSRQTRRGLGLFALVLLLLGTLLFSGTLVAAHLFALPTRPAPFGGVMMIAGWLLYAVDAFRR